MQPSRAYKQREKIREAMLAAAVALGVPALIAQETPANPAAAASPAAPEAQSSQAPAQAPQPAAAPAQTMSAAGPIAIVPIDNKGAVVTGAMEVTAGRAMIASSGTVTAGKETEDVTLPRRGVLKVCASTKVSLAADTSVPAGEIPGLMMAMDHGAVEASFATGVNSDAIMTPDFRILIGGPGAADVKVRLGDRGDTCVENAGVNAPYVLVSSVFGAGVYRVQAGQRVMFEHGNVNEVVDHEKESCGCPPPPPQNNAFPEAQSEGLAPLAKPAPTPAEQSGKPMPEAPGLVYNSAEHQPQPVPQAAQPATQAANAPPAPPQKKKPGFFARLGHFFKNLAGSD